MSAMLTPQAIIFDFDGVIADSEIVSAIAFSQALSEAGLPTSLEEAQDRYTGLTRDDTLAAISDHWGARVPADIEQRIADYADAAFAQDIAPVSGAIDFVGAVTHLPLAIGSSSRSTYIRELLASFDLAAPFGPHIYSGREHVTRGKPHPDIYLHAAAALGVHPRACLIIEDSPIGARAAVAAGAHVIGLCAGSHCRPDHGEQLRAVGVHAIVSDYAVLGEMLGL